jgi:WD40 repeat protein
MTAAGGLVDATTELCVLDEPVVALAVASPSRFTAVGSEGVLVHIDVVSGDVPWTARIDDAPLAACWNGRGDRLAVGAASGVHVRDAQGAPSFAIAEGWCSSVAWSPDDALLAAGQGRWSIVVDDEAAPVWSAEAASTVTGVAWVKNRLAVSAYGGVVIHEPRSGRVTQTMPFKGSLLVLTPSPDGRWITSGNQDATLHAWRVGRQNDELTMQGYAVKVTALDFSADSRFLACNGAHEVSVWDFSGKGPAGTSPRVLRGHDDLVDVVRWAPSQRTLATGGRDGRVCVYAPERGVPGRPMAPQRSVSLGAKVTALAWTDDQTLLAGAADGAVRTIRLDA